MTEIELESPPESVTVIRTTASPLADDATKKLILPDVTTGTTLLEYNTDNWVIHGDVVSATTDVTVSRLSLPVDTDVMLKELAPIDAIIWEVSVLIVGVCNISSTGDEGFSVDAVPEVDKKISRADLPP